ncbi:MAG: M20/M25/M40 family metallo-hydrolase, partial [Planctomycetota bacterium]
LSVGLPDAAADPAAAPWIDALAAVARAGGAAARRTAARYGTNASVFAEGGVPSVVFGPGCIDQAHTADEWIELAQVDAAAAALVALVAGG